MRKKRQGVFADPSKVNDVLRLHAEGRPLSMIASKYRVTEGRIRQVIAEENTKGGPGSGDSDA